MSRGKPTPFWVCLGRVLGYSCRDRGSCIGGKAERVSEVFPIIPLCSRSEAKNGVSAGVAGIMVAGVPGVASGGRRARERDSLYWCIHYSLDVGIVEISKPCFR